MTNTQKTQLGVIGGSGLYAMSEVKIIDEHDVDTPYGKPSDKVIEGEINGRKVFFIPRHGVGHRLNPSEVPYRANIYAMKSFGVTHLLAVSAVGIMKDNIKPGDMVCPDQLFDRTKGSRDSTFFEGGIVGHVMFADPFSAEMRQIICHAAEKVAGQVHSGGAYVCMEGPQFSTRAESHFYRQTLKPAVIGMTAIPEAKLALEAEIAYGMLALATDYDCWNESEEDVSVEAVMAVLKANSEKANKIVAEVARSLPETSSCPTLSAAHMAIITAKDRISTAAKERLQLLYGKYL